MSQPHHLSVSLAPTDNAPEPRIYLYPESGAGLRFYGPTSFVQVDLSFGNLTDPAGYLRDLAATCLGLARMVEAEATRSEATA